MSHNKILVVCVGWGVIYLLYWKRKSKAIKEFDELKKALDIDTLKINRMLTFGVSKTTCQGHSTNEFHCVNLDCNYGRLR